jgi:hypothetical protein
MPKSVSQQMAANVSYHIFYGTGDWTQDLKFARQVLYHLSHAPSPWLWYWWNSESLSGPTRSSRCDCLQLDQGYLAAQLHPAITTCTWFYSFAKLSLTSHLFFSSMQLFASHPWITFSSLVHLGPMLRKKCVSEVTLWLCSWLLRRVTCPFYWPLDSVTSASILPCFIFSVRLRLPRGQRLCLNYFSIWTAVPSKL